MGVHNLFVISGPSGCGKSTLIRMLMKRHRDLRFAVSHTTRPMRRRETHGRDYYFVTEPRFLQMVKEDRFSEWARVHSHYYGTSWDEIRKKSAGDDILVLDLDVQGAANIKERFPQALLVFVLPPSWEELARRLKGREKREDKGIEERLRNARSELKEYKRYDFIVINHNLEKALSALNAMVHSFRQATFRQEGFVEKLIGGGK